MRRGDVQGRKGWGRCVGGVLRGGGSVGVVSVNWSCVWIRACLGALALALREGVPEMDKVKVVANEIEGLDGEAGSSGGLGRYFGEAGGGIWTCGDKGRCVGEMLAENTGVGEEGGVSVYVGDSVTDLEALMGVDVGVCIGEGEGELKACAERVGVGWRWVGEFRGSADGWERGGERVLWWARDFDEICESRLFPDLLDSSSR